MGSKNPIKQIYEGAADFATRPLAEISNAVGAEGVANLFENIGNETKKGLGAVTDVASGKADRMKQEAKKQGAMASAAAQEAAASEERRRAAAESARIESERMAPGQRARTLLTGAEGAPEDEEMSITRRTLSGF